MGTEKIIKLHRKAKPLRPNFDGKDVLPKWSRMEVVLKVTERCNINCTYCYFFNSKNQDFKNHPTYIKLETIEECARFLKKTVNDSGIESIQIDFHGGEPLMMKKQRFDEMCRVFSEHLEEVKDVKFAIQTNATLIDEEWIRIFSKHQIGIGISLDGPEECHDKYRIDHKGHGTYAATIRGLRLIQASQISDIKKDIGVGVICVINPDSDAKKIFNHFVDDLHLTSLHYLLPMDDHDTYEITNTPKITKYLCDLFDAWAERRNPKIKIRYFQRLLAQLIGGKTVIERANAVTGDCMVLTVASNGDVGMADDLRNTFPHLFWTKCNVSNTSLTDFLKLPLIETHLVALQERHDDCKSCCWGNICGGGDLMGTEAFRYSTRNSFRNKSIYCEAIQELLTHMTKFAIRSGVSFEKISESLIDDKLAPLET